MAKNAPIPPRIKAADTKNIKKQKGNITAPALNTRDTYARTITRFTSSA